MIICIGPICIPLWGLLPMLWPLMQRAWAWLRSFWSPAPAAKEAETEESVGSGSSTTMTSEAEVHVSGDGLRHRSTGRAAVCPAEVVEVTSMEQWDALVALTESGGAPMVVKFTATWCRPCKLIQPVFEELAAGVPGTDAVFAVVDVDELDEAAAASGVSALPHFQVFRSGKLAENILGPTAESLRTFVASLKL